MVHPAVASHVRQARRSVGKHTRCNLISGRVWAALVVLAPLSLMAILAPASGAGAPSTATEAATSASLLAERYRPRLFFDSHERWRPLDVERFFASGQARMCRSATDCEPATTDRFAATTTGYLDIDGSFDAVSSYRSVDPGCVHPPLLDCNNGLATALYFQIVSHQGYRYIDYWAYYRVNHFGLRRFDHESDWEGITVAVPRQANAASFDFVIFPAHEHGWRYLREALVCEDDPKRRCGQTAQRVSAYVARGSHASYPRKCRGIGGFCRQTGRPIPERPFNGRSEWSANNDPATLKPFEDHAWVRWAGTWDVGRNVKSPGNQARFRAPWSYRCSGRYAPGRPRCWTQGQGRRVATDPCAAWIGPFTTAVACDADELASAIVAGRLSRGREVTFQGNRLLRSATVSGLTQTVGDPLQPGDELLIRGDPTRGTELAVRAENRKYERTFFFDNLGSAWREKAELHVKVGTRLPEVFIQPEGLGIRSQRIRPSDSWLTVK